MPRVPSWHPPVTDPKEEHPISAYIADTWVDYPLYQVLEDFDASLEEDPGTPGPAGREDSSQIFLHAGNTNLGK